jgi:ABC-type siderophore export system fused ATPase/permease subunit
VTGDGEAHVAKSWIYRLTLRGRAREMGLGSFDEWAADQDPYFKAMFYEQILPELRQRKKAVLVITHDAQFFDTADELVTMKDGMIAAIRTRRMGDERTAFASGGSGR